MDWSKSIIYRIGFYRFVTFVFCYLFFSVTLGYLIKNNDEATESQIIQNKETLTPNIKSKDLKRILFWTGFFDKPDFEFGFGQEPFIRAGCSYTNCYTTTDRSYLAQSDALIFHAHDYNNSDLPPIRLSNQRYVFLNYEAIPVETDEPIFAESPPHYFNWTMTYRRNSDIFSTAPYGVVKRVTPFDVKLPLKLAPGILPPNPKRFMMKPKKKKKKKKKMMVWLNSHCNTDSLREEFFEQLSRYIPIEVYGSCGNLSCLPWNSIECFDMLDDYKFYISAENTFCPDYVTEKLHRALNRNVVPIVYGGADYSAYTPPHSVIHAADFKSIKDLAGYLKLLDNNDALYSKYLEWKSDYKVILKPMDGWCDLCKRLNDPEQIPKSYEDMSQWWIHDAPCLPGEKFLTSI